MKRLLYVEELLFKAVPGSGFVLNASEASNCSAKLLLVLKSMKIPNRKLCLIVKGEYYVLL